jgi:hypothetical protein
VGRLSVSGFSGAGVIWSWPRDLTLAAALGPGKFPGQHEVIGKLKGRFVRSSCILAGPEVHIRNRWYAWV